MTGNKRSGFVVQDRDRHLLSELGVMRILDRESSKIVAGFGSTRRANDRLLQLVRAGLLRRFFRRQRCPRQKSGLHAVAQRRGTRQCQV